jgi:hypothetical protein
VVQQRVEHTRPVMCGALVQVLLNHCTCVAAASDALFAVATQVHCHAPVYKM